VRLPNGVFNPYTGINTNLLFFTKGAPTRETWYFEHPLTADRKQYSKTRPIEVAEFELEKAWWSARQENEHAWRVTIDEIKARNYNLDIKNPNVEDPSHGDPIKLLMQYRALQAEIAEARAKLRDELAAALERTAGHEA
jgi:type I restriction enzyme M protein